MADCILIHALTLAVLGSWGERRAVYIFPSLPPLLQLDVSSAPQFLFYFSTKSMGFKKQSGSGKAGKLPQGAGIPQLLPGKSHGTDSASHNSYCGKGTRGSDPQQVPAPESWCQSVLPGQFTVLGASWSLRVTLPGLQTITY